MAVHQKPRAPAPTPQPSRANKVNDQRACGPVLPSNAAALQRLAGNQAVTAAIVARGVPLQRQGEASGEAVDAEDIEEQYSDAPAVQKPFKP